MPALPDLPEGIKGRQPQQRKQQVFHSLRGILLISVPSEEEHQHISVINESEHQPSHSLTQLTPGCWLVEEEDAG